ncbi:Glycosyltransferase involved in cell wall bisynthesis [Austwickia chelonae]|uniref:D-inositol 3-phosphate glycosyltransferase n=1 Tax=Austwickia chelonae NBRC 105200 TaxID=1184607 RepID=K6VJA7_9MICO|nr:glycosyltransferase family 4 protein [Austwickia chelonae]GAB76824.1 hypothetical protein AUCHE_03_00410 [Austwickia chelonae NBRC 105200]SEW31181.1 Glycosyltransferase involved in cell wall bisynthesis [Austwickia chelonae]
MTPRQILLITKEFGLPARSGGMLRTLAIARALATVGEVTIAHPGGLWQLPEGSRDDFVTIAPGRTHGIRDNLKTFATYRTVGGARTCGQGLLDAVRDALRQDVCYDAAVLDHTCLLRVRSLLPADLPVVASMHNVESDLMKQRIGAEQGIRKIVAAVEHRWLLAQERSAADLPTVVCTQADVDELLSRGGAKASVVARNGVDPVTDSARGPEAETSQELLFTGALDWGPNTSGLRWLVASDAWKRLCAERPGLVLTVAGRRPSPEFLADMAAAPSVRVEADVPDMKPLLERARLGVAPLLEGGGSRIKLLEYIAHGLPSVSTYVGASGLDHLPQGAVTQVPEDAEVFCAAVRTALDEGPAVLSADAIEHGLRWYSWAAALEPLTELVADKNEEG